MSIQLVITRTSKPMGKRIEADDYSDGFSTFDQEKVSFKNMSEARDYLRETYGNCKHQPMYQDQENGEAKRIGTIYCFKNADYSHSPVEHWFQQDWVSFYKVTPLTI